MLKKINKIINHDFLVHNTSFFFMCDFCYSTYDSEITISCNISDVSDNSLIYVDRELIKKFITEIHPKISNKYILLSMASPYPVWDSNDIDYHKENLDKILAWFCTIAKDENFTFDRAYPLPIGIHALSQNDDLYYKTENTLSLFKKAKSIEKKQLICNNSGKHTLIREAVYNIFKDKSFCHTSNQRIPYEDFIMKMAEYKFIITPKGDALDGCRYWDALSVGCIPIIINSKLKNIFSELPVLFINDYNEVTEDFLNYKYEEFKYKNYNLDKLYIKYWDSKINSKKLN